jgi:serine/threonine protein kinase
VGFVSPNFFSVTFQKLISVPTLTGKKKHDTNEMQIRSAKKIRRKKKKNMGADMSRTFDDGTSAHGGASTTVPVEPNANLMKEADMKVDQILSSRSNLQKQRTELIAQGKKFMLQLKSLITPDSNENTQSLIDANIELLDDAANKSKPVLQSVSSKLQSVGLGQQPEVVQMDAMVNTPTEAAPDQILKNLQTLLTKMEQKSTSDPKAKQTVKQAIQTIQKMSKRPSTVIQTEPEKLESVSTRAKIDKATVKTLLNQTLKRTEADQQVHLNKSLKAEAQVNVSQDFNSKKEKLVQAKQELDEAKKDEVKAELLQRTIKELEVKPIVATEQALKETVENAPSEQVREAAKTVLQAVVEAKNAALVEANPEVKSGGAVLSDLDSDKDAISDAESKLSLIEASVRTSLKLAEANKAEVVNEVKQLSSKEANKLVDLDQQMQDLKLLLNQIQLYRRKGLTASKRAADPLVVPEEPMAAIAAGIQESELYAAFYNRKSLRADSVVDMTKAQQATKIADSLKDILAKLKEVQSQLDVAESANQVQAAIQTAQTLSNRQTPSIYRSLAETRLAEADVNLSKAQEKLSIVSIQNEDRKTKRMLEQLEDLKEQKAIVDASVRRSIMNNDEPSKMLALDQKDVIQRQIISLKTNIEKSMATSSRLRMSLSRQKTVTAVRQASVRQASARLLQERKTVNASKRMEIAKDQNVIQQSLRKTVEELPKTTVQGIVVKSKKLSRATVKEGELIVNKPVKSQQDVEKSILAALVAAKKQAFTYDYFKYIGGGAFGQVYMAGTAIRNEAGELTGVTNTIAIKRIPKESTPLQWVRDEVDILTVLQPKCHEYIICYENFHEDADNYYIMTEFVGGDREGVEYRSLKDVVTKDFKPDPITMGTIVINLIKGLQVIHSLGIAHRDIKPENIMVSTKGGIKFLDFGLSCLDQRCKGLGGIEGTIGYIAPECYDPEFKKNSTLKDMQLTDLWSLGITIWEIISNVSCLTAWNLQRAALLKAKSRKSIAGAITSTAQFYDGSDFAMDFSFPEHQDSVIQDINKSVDDMLRKYCEGLCKPFSLVVFLNRVPANRTFPALEFTIRS